MFDGKIGSSRKVTYGKAQANKGKKEFVEDAKRLREVENLLLYSIQSVFNSNLSQPTTG